MNWLSRGHREMRHTPSTWDVSTQQHNCASAHQVATKPQFQIRGKKTTARKSKAQAPMWSRIFLGWGTGGTGRLLVQYMVKSVLPLLEKNNIKQGVQKWNKHIPLVRKKLRRQLAGIVQRETTSAVYLDGPWWVQTILCSMGPNPKDNKNKQKSLKSQ